MGEAKNTGGRLYLCPCCDQLTGPRTTRITPGECARGYEVMARRGWTVERLLAEQGETLDAIAPGMTDFLRGLADAHADQAAHNQIETLRSEHKTT